MALLDGRICLVTGATAGIGEVTARRLAEMGATVILVARDPARCRSAVERITAATGNERIESFVADLSSKEAIRGLAAQVKQRYDRLDVLVNNAGAIFHERRESVDGLEMTFALNHMGYFHLTNLLLDLLRESPSARVVNLSSSAHYMGLLQLDDLQATRWFFGWKVYGDSKLANLYFTYELARRLQGSRITVNAVHPGVIDSNFGSTYGGIGGRLTPLIRPFLKDTEQGAGGPVRLASDPALEGVTGRYFSGVRESSSARRSHNRAIAERLWEISTALSS